MVLRVGIDILKWQLNIAEGLGISTVYWNPPLKIITVSNSRKKQNLHQIWLLVSFLAWLLSLSEFLVSIGEEVIKLESAIPRGFFLMCHQGGFFLLSFHTVCKR